MTNIEKIGESVNAAKAVDHNAEAIADLIFFYIKEYNFDLSKVEKVDVIINFLTDLSRAMYSLGYVHGGDKEAL